MMIAWHTFSLLFKHWWQSLSLFVVVFRLCRLNLLMSRYSWSFHVVLCCVFLYYFSHFSSRSNCLSLFLSHSLLLHCVPFSLVKNRCWNEWLLVTISYNVLKQNNNISRSRRRTKLLISMPKLTPSPKLSNNCKNGKSFVRSFVCVSVCLVILPMRLMSVHISISF